MLELKSFHERICMAQGRSQEYFQNQCRAIDLSVDGVRETKHGKRNFVFVSIRFGGRAIYTIKVFNPLLGVPEAKPSVDCMIG